ncbi:MAG: TetR/AcrR family transcriptional regulator [Eubacteriales bacterium]
MDTLAKTKKGQNTKQKIIDVSKQLFYEQGFNDTTVAQITDDAEVNNGLFTYYFGSKIKLANMVSTEYRLKLRNAVSKKMFEDFREYNLALGIAVETRMNVKISDKYPKLLRYNIEVYSENQSPINMNFTNFPTKKGDREVNTKRDHFYKLQKRLINPDISDLDLKFYQVTGIAVSNSIMAAYHEGSIDCSTDYIGDKLVDILFYMLGLDKECIEELSHKSKVITDKLDFKLIPYFDLEY